MQEPPYWAPGAVTTITSVIIIIMQCTTERMNELAKEINNERMKRLTNITYERSNERMNE